MGVPGTIFNELQSTFSLSATALTGLAAITFLIYGIMQVFAGITADTVSYTHLTLPTNREV